MNLNKYQQYKTQSVLTMTPGEMLILLYDELLKRLSRANYALEQEDYVLFEQSVTRSVEIVTYLKDTLDYKYDISQELRNMYDFFILELGRISAGRSKQVIEELIPLVKDLRNTFDEAAKRA